MRGSEKVRVPQSEEVLDPFHVGALISVRVLVYDPVRLGSEEDYSFRWNSLDGKLHIGRGQRSCLRRSPERVAVARIGLNSIRRCVCVCQFFADAVVIAHFQLPLPRRPHLTCHTSSSTRSLPSPAEFSSAWESARAHGQIYPVPATSLLATSWPTACFLTWRSLESTSACLVDQ